MKTQQLSENWRFFAVEKPELTAPRSDDLHITLCCFAEREYIACREILGRTDDPFTE